MGKKLSASQAAKRVGKSVPTISRAIKSGKLSAEPNPEGGWLIDPSELARVYGETPATGDAKGHTLGQETPNETGVLQAELSFLRQRLEDREAAIADLKQERDDWKQQAQTLLIANQNAPAKTPARRGFLGLFGARA